MQIAAQDRSEPLDVLQQLLALLYALFVTTVAVPVCVNICATC
jgi:hypothetical protein